MKLWVDDIRNAPDESWHVARTVTAAINALAHFAFEEISLDHDISHQVQIGTGLERPFPCEEKFLPVAYYIAATKGQFFLDTPAPKITIHSSNPVGAQDMANILRSCGIEPEIRPMGMANRLETEV